MFPREHGEDSDVRTDVDKRIPHPKMLRDARKLFRLELSVEEDRTPLLSPADEGAACPS